MALSKCSFLLYGYLVFRVSEILLTPSTSPFFWSSFAPSTTILITCTTPSNISQPLSSFADCVPLSRYSGLVYIRRNHRDWSDVLHLLSDQEAQCSRVKSLLNVSTTKIPLFSFSKRTSIFALVDIWNTS